MNKNLIYIILVGLLLVAGCKSKNQTSESSNESQVILSEQKPGNTQQKTGKIKTDSKPGFSNKYDRGQKKRESIVDKFDPFGNLIERTENDYDKNGFVKFKKRYTYRYDEKQRRIEQWFYQYTPDDRPVFSHVNYIKYDNMDNKIENIFIGYDGQGNESNWAKNLYKNNADGKVTEDVTYNKQGFPVYKINYNYENGMLISENSVNYDGKGGIINKQTLFYDEYGTVIKTLDE